MFSKRRPLVASSLSRLLLSAIAVVAVAGCLKFASFAKSGIGGASNIAASTGDEADLQARIRDSFGKLPITFEPNRGQTDPQVKYLARGRGYTLFLTPTEAVFAMPMHPVTKAAADRNAGSTSVLRMKMIGASQGVQLDGESRLAGVSNYLIGKDRSKWRTGVPQFARVNYSEIYPGIDLAFHGSEQYLEFDYIVGPGADPSRVELSFAGAEKMITEDNGDLILSTKTGDMRFHKPIAYQEEEGSRVPVQASFAIRDGRVGFSLGDYDRTRQLVIDPVFVYSTYLGGSGDDHATSIAVDANGNAYVTGVTNSANFPVLGGVAPNSLAGFDDVFVTELNPSGTGLVFSTYIGGTNHDAGHGIAVDSTGIYVAGETASDDFPVTPTTFNPNQNGGLDAFVLKLNSSGSSLAWSGFIGGENDDQASGLTVDSAGNAYVAGQTLSELFPLVNALFTDFNKGALGAISDGFVSVVKADGTAFLFSSYLGGSAADRANGIAVDANKNIYVTGGTQSTDFPVTDATTCHVCSGAPDAFVTKIKSDFSALSYSTYLGGSLSDEGFAVAVDSAGDAVVTGQTASTNFPFTGSAFQKILSGGASTDAFVTKYNATGTSLVFSTYLGGDGLDQGVGLALDSNQDVYVFGQTQSTNFPTQNFLQDSLQGGADAFVAELTPDGSGLLFSTYLGGTQQEGTLASMSGGIALDSLNNMYVAGFTNSFDFPLASPFQNSLQGSSDIFVTKYTAATPAPSYGLTADPPAVTVTAGASASTDITVTPETGFTGNVTFSCTSGVPSGASCSFSPATVGPTGTSTLTISTTGPAMSQSNDPRQESLPIYASLFPIFGLALAGASIKKRPGKSTLLGVLMIAMMLSGLVFLSACGGGGGGNGSTPKGTYTIQVTGTSGLDSKSTTVSLTVE